MPSCIPLAQIGAWQVLIQANVSLNRQARPTSINWLLFGVASPRQSPAASAAASVMNWCGVGQREASISLDRLADIEGIRGTVNECTLRCNPNNYWHRPTARDTIHHRTTYCRYRVKRSVAESSTNTSECCHELVHFEWLYYRNKWGKTITVMINHWQLAWTLICNISICVIYLFVICNVTTTVCLFCIIYTGWPKNGAIFCML